ncbi:MAG: aminopeptidase P family protein [Clostridia bacterium]|nr:aminopeptidase P family protein [Clostridia bacterium]
MPKLIEFREKLKELGIDAALITSEINQYYLCDFPFQDGYLFISSTEAYLVTDFRYYEAALEKRFSDFEVLSPKDRTGTLRELICSTGAKTLGFEGSNLSYRDYIACKEKYSDITLVDLGTTIEDLREIKTEGEILNMQKAQDITDAAFSHLLRHIRRDMTEIEVAAELEYAMRRMGADSPAFETIAVSGDASAVPHGTPRGVKLRDGFLTLDFGAKYKGYCSDMTRTLVIGRADADIKRLYNTVLRAQSEALQFLRMGVSPSRADAVARDVIDAIPEYKGTFGHSLGHSVGLMVHESPTLSPRAKREGVKVGEIYTVEPGIYLMGRYGCRIEDMVKITESGVYNFTHSTKELIEIE